MHFMKGGNFVCEECGDVRHSSDLIVKETDGVERMLCCHCYIESTKKDPEPKEVWRLSYSHGEYHIAHGVGMYRIIAPPQVIKDILKERERTTPLFRVWCAYAEALSTSHLDIADTMLKRYALRLHEFNNDLPPYTYHDSDFDKVIDHGM